MLGLEQRLVLQEIERAGNKGIWTRDIKSHTNIPQQIVTKTLRLLETRRLVKSVKSISSKNKKLYMLFDLVPSTEITGGPWYNEQEFDHVFIDTLSTFVYEVIKASGMSTLNAITDKVHASGISKVALGPEEIRSIIQTLMYDGRVEEVRSVRLTPGASHEVKYKVSQQITTFNYLSETPCVPGRERHLASLVSVHDQVAGAQGARLLASTNTYTFLQLNPMERPLLDARHATPAASTSAPASSSGSRGAVALFPTSGGRERAVPANPGLASFPHEDVDPMRSYAPPCSASNPVAGTTVASSTTAGTAGFRSVPLPRWSPSPLTPRYLAAGTHHPPPPLGALLASSAPGSGTTSVSSAEGIGSDHYYHYSNTHGATSTRAMETAQRQETEQTGNGLGGLSGTAMECVNSSGASAMTMTATLAALPLPMTRQLVIPQPPPPAVIATIPSRKRKRVPGAMRMRNFLCMHPGCGKSFTDSAHLRDHTVVHTGEKKLSCPTCHKLFARASTLQEHIRVHTGEKPYACDVPGCNKRYSSRAAMRFHRTTHVTQIAFTQTSAVSIHASGDVNAVQFPSEQVTPFLCQECGKHFRVRELLMAHLKVHAAHRAAAAVSALTSLSPHGTAIQRRISGEETNTVHRLVGDEDTPLRGEVPVPPEDSRYLQDTIRAQQDQIEQLKAEVLRLRGQASLDSTATRAQTVASSSTASTAPALTAPVEMLRDGFKPFECCICHNRFANFYQLTFHGKQHPERSMAEVTGEQAPLPVGPKYCPEAQCEYSESTGRSLRNLQTLKRHWQRRHQTERPYACSFCSPTRQKTFKTRENLKAHEKDCTKNDPVR
ncbi:DNA-directed RNA polymerase III subunit rpc6 [Phytophthora citrophthora]|uniref:DNA-directed RNA polymerase III subunit rpc6 n=1 Tax=Phytophthora citrophthora TaxID=4793 RepID=A0AAD9L9T0_9STRA|nr:DNA-directed RNA polymerase III subunit rpc6 [Phytophthora citrophthora]